MYLRQGRDTPSQIAPSDNPREVYPGRQAEPHSTLRECGYKIYRGNLEDVIELERCWLSKANKERPGPRGVDRASSRGIIGHLAAAFQL